MKISVIIAFYKNLPFLELIIGGLLRQRHNDFEVVIAEDDDAAATKEYILRRRSELPFVLKHVCQPDDGFRKNRILNAAMRAAEGEMLVFFDGDCIPHHQCLYEYAKAVEEGVAFFGRRVMLGKQLTERLVSTGDRRLLSIYNQMRLGVERLEDGLYLPFFRKSRKKNGIMGCNWGILKKHLVAVNGYDEDYITAGVGEDVDIEWRLLANGIILQSMKHRAIVYHLYHSAHYSPDAPVGYALLKEKKAAGRVYCAHGLDQHQKN